MERDAWVFIGVFFFIFLIWVIIGNPFRAPSVRLPEVPDISLSASTTGTLSPSKSYLQLPRSPYAVGGDTVCLIGSTSCTGFYSGNTASYSQGVPAATANISFSSASSYRGLVSLNTYVSNPGATDPKTEYVQIYLAQNAPAPLTITGWRLVSKVTGAVATIPKGVQTLTVGKVNSTSDIILRPGESAMIISGPSPVGLSFRENVCTGYLGGLQSFTPPLPKNCPEPIEELGDYYDGAFRTRDAACIDYTQSISRCKTITYSKKKELSSSCWNFLEHHLNYNGCVSTHQNESDFNGKTWRIYLGSSAPLWRTKSESIALIDNEGKVVASFNY
jgi:hypothetical protein